MSYDFNKQVASYQAQGAQGGGGGLYVKGVKVKKMFLADDPSKGDMEIMFRILPAIDISRTYKDSSGKLVYDMGSSVPFRDASGAFTPWGRIIYVMKYAGHGKGGKDGSRRDLVSLRSFAEGDSPEACPLETFIAAVRRDPMWKYLTEDVMAQDGRTRLESKPVPFSLTRLLLANVIDVRRAGDGVQLGEFPTSAMKSILDPQTGLAFVRNLNATEAEIRANPNCQWNVGDLTDISDNGLVLKLVRRLEQGKAARFQSYAVEIATKSDGRPYRLGVPASYLSQRYNLLDLPGVMTKPTQETLIQQLVQMYNRFHPTGQAHEWELLKGLFGHIVRIPAPPARGSVPGFTQSAAPGGFPGPVGVPNLPASLPGMSAPAGAPPSGGMPEGGLPRTFNDLTNTPPGAGAGTRLPEAPPMAPQPYVQQPPAAPSAPTGTVPPAAPMPGDPVGSDAWRQQFINELKSQQKG